MRAKYVTPSVAGSQRFTGQLGKIWLTAPRSSGLFNALAPLAAVFMLCVVLQPFLFRPLQVVIIAVRLIILPSVTAFLVFNQVEIVMFAGIVVLSLIAEVVNHTKFTNEDWQIILSILGAFPMFKAGLLLASDNRSRPVWLAILYSTLILNLVTIAIYANTLRGGGIADHVFSKVYREGEDPLFRFALGNAIEIPALLAITAVCGAAVLQNRAPYLSYVLFVNLVAAAISQSRLVLFISAFAVLKMWRHYRMISKIAIIACLLTIVYDQNAAFRETLTSLSLRYSGYDDNSASDRFERCVSVVKNTNWHCFVFGNGANSSLTLMQNVGLGYHTVEAGIFHLFWEIGLPRMILEMLFLWFIVKRSGMRFAGRPELVLITGQVFLLLPIMTFTPIYMFLIGAIAVKPARMINLRRKRHEQIAGVW